MNWVAVIRKDIDGSVIEIPFWENGNAHDALEKGRNIALNQRGMLIQIKVA